VSFLCFVERPDGGQTDDVTYGHAPGRAGGVTLLGGWRALSSFTSLL
jgi:hypothetical protein